jgi:hypothetical protein
MWPAGGVSRGQAEKPGEGFKARSPGRLRRRTIQTPLCHDRSRHRACRNSAAVRPARQWLSINHARDEDALDCGIPAQMQRKTCRRQTSAMERVYQERADLPPPGRPARQPLWHQGGGRQPGFGADIPHPCTDSDIAEAGFRAGRNRYPHVMPMRKQCSVRDVRRRLRYLQLRSSPEPPARSGSPPAGSACPRHGSRWIR